MTKEEFDEQYPRLAHALQSGVAASIALDSNDATRSQTGVAHSPKMLRTGVNMTMVELSSLATLLLAKGILTWEEYRRALVEGLRDEVARYEAELSAKYGKPVKLG